MSTALVRTRALIADIRAREGLVLSHVDLLDALAGIETALVSDRPIKPRSRLMGATLLTMTDLGPGCTPMQLGHALDPSKDGYRAGMLGGNRLNLLNGAGLVWREHFGWWVLTAEGHAEILRLRAEGAKP